MKKQPYKKRSVTIFILFLFTLFSHGGNALGATAVEIQQYLQAHNQKRTLHRVPSVTWSNTVANSAQNHADTCPSGHSSSGYGENLFWSTPGFSSIQGVVDGWYNEEPLYDYNNPGWNPIYGHFTQVVWKNTTQIGCGYRTGCPEPWTNVWVCQYNPYGNVLGQFAANVFPPGPTPLVFLPILLFNIPDGDVVCPCWSAEDVAEWVGIVDAQPVEAECDIYDEDGSSQYGNFGWKPNENMMTASDDYSTNQANPGACWYDRDGSSIQHFAYITQAEVDACGRLLDDGIKASSKCDD